MRVFEKNHISSATTTTVLNSQQGVLRYITVNTTAAGAITVYDGTTSGTVVAILKSNIAEGTYRFDCVMSKGITVVTAAASDITVVWEVLN